MDSFYSLLDVLHKIPIFILDTSLGAAKSPSVGDVFLSTVDALGMSKDVRNRLRRGDLIRVGHPEEKLFVFPLIPDGDSRIKLYLLAQLTMPILMRPYRLSRWSMPRMKYNHSTYGQDRTP